jgi:hypothetical protein
VLDGFEEPAAGLGHFGYRAVEGLLIGAGGLVKSANLAHELQGRSV